MKESIRKANQYIDENREKVDQQYRGAFHLLPPIGWMNDPNGFVYFRGEYHLFYQFYPYDSVWGAMHWGHAKSKDLLHWEELPVALAPSESYDKDGCFSGSAIVKDDKLYLLYTGHVDDEEKREETQCLAVSTDGITFEKIPTNPVIHMQHIDGIADIADFRDPKVFEYKGSYYTVVASKTVDDRGQILLFASSNLEDWSFKSVLLEGEKGQGIMWECPDFYQLGDKYVLTFSPMGSGDHTSVYLTGDFDYKTGKFDWHISGEMDWGFDFYAPQSMVAPDGRRLIVAWANEWEWMPLFKDWGPTYQEGWCGFFNVIREVRMCKDGTLAFVPVEEMEKIRENKFTQREIQITETPQQLKAGDGISFEMKFTLDLEETDADRVELKLRCGKEKESRCIFDLKNGELLVDRSCADGWSVGTSRSVLKVSEKSLDVHIFSDQSSLEIFTDQYRNNHSNNIFAGNDQDAISISAFGGRAVIRDYEAYGLQECFN